MIDLKHAFSLSDEEVVSHWTGNVVWQSFSGMECYAPRPPCEATQIGRLALKNLKSTAVLQIGDLRQPNGCTELKPEAGQLRNWLHPLRWPVRQVRLESDLREKPGQRTGFQSRSWNYGDDRGAYLITYVIVYKKLTLPEPGGEFRKLAPSKVWVDLRERCRTHPNLDEARKPQRSILIVREGVLPSSYILSMRFSPLPYQSTSTCCPWWKSSILPACEIDMMVPDLARTVIMIPLCAVAASSALWVAE